VFNNLCRVSTSAGAAISVIVFRSNHGLKHMYKSYVLGCQAVSSVAFL
jgi:hypothetical protein